MRYVIDGLLQTKIIEYKLSERERKLFEFMAAIGSGRNTIREQFYGMNHFWLKYIKFAYEYIYLFPDLEADPDNPEVKKAITKQVGKHVKALVDKGLISLHVERSPKGVFTYVAFTKEYYSLLSSNPENYDQTTAIEMPNDCALAEDHYASERSPLTVEAQSSDSKSAVLCEQKSSHNIQPTKNIPTNIQIKGKNNKKSTSELVFNFEGFSETEITAVNEWLDYKKEIKDFYKTQIGLNKFRTNLLNFKRDQKNIIALIDYAISHEWKGVYEVKNNSSSSFSPKEETFIPNFTVAAELDPFLS